MKPLILLLSVGTCFAQSHSTLSAGDDWTVSVPDAHRLSQSDRGDTRTARAINNAAVNLYQQGQYGHAEKLYSEALRIWNQHPEAKTDRIHTCVNLAAVLSAQGRFADAEKLYLEALRQSAPAEPVSLLNNLATLYRNIGHLNQADQYARRALKSARSAAQMDPAVLAKVLQTSGSILLLRYKLRQAEDLYSEAVSLVAESRGETHPDYAAVLASLAEVNIRRHDYAKAESLSKQALQIWDNSLGSNHVYVATAENNLAQIYRFERRFAEAEPLYRHALSVWERNLGTNHPDYAKGLSNLADCLYERGDYGRAGDLYAILKSNSGERRPPASDSGRTLAQAQRGSTLEARSSR